MAGRLRRVQPGTGGITRRRVGRGFTYLGANGKRIEAAATLERIRGLGIPPAWTDVWIASQANAHIQATGIDAAGRTQYLYHPRWRELRDVEKFLRARSFAQRLPAVRRTVTRDLRQTRDGRRRALAAAVRLLDRGGLRVGGAAYAEENGSFGASTLQRRHVEVEGDLIRLAFRGKSGGDWDVRVEDPLLGAFFAEVPRSPRGAPAICYPVREGRRTRWNGVSAADINDYLSDAAGAHITAKDFRTWQGTVVAARSLARALRTGDSSPAAVAAAIQDAADWLHNTPTVARDSYVDPHVVKCFEQGRAADFRRQPDRAVLDLLT
ncbi:MAG: DNA topoisomerase IB [Arthrobacter sp.]|uniref:DNA topoisomerase IB n=1 Tax=Arthrobacter sp. TaxID=1667 RepID=UPI003499EB72